MARKPFNKNALDLHGQCILLASRGLVFDDWADAHSHLEHVGYYRFTGYLHPFKLGIPPEPENFILGTTFNSVHDRYVFDRKLRMLILEAVEKIEVAARSAISNSLAMRHGPHWYLDRSLFAQPNYMYPKGKINIINWHAQFIDNIKREIGHDDAHRRDVFIKHYYETYDQPELPPCWMIFEVISFGSISHCFKFLRQNECKEVCLKFGQSHQVLSSWLHSVSYLRNLCAHHARAWNRILTIKPIIPKALRIQFNHQNDRIYADLLALQLLLQKIWTNNHWAEALSELIASHPNVPLGSMGFPNNWRDAKAWGFN